MRSRRPPDADGFPPSQNKEGQQTNQPTERKTQIHTQIKKASLLQAWLGALVKMVDCFFCSVASISLGSCTSSTTGEAFSQNRTARVCGGVVGAVWVGGWLGFIYVHKEGEGKPRRGLLQCQLQVPPQLLADANEDDVAMLPPPSSHSSHTKTCTTWYAHTLSLLPCCCPDTYSGDGGHTNFFFYCSLHIDLYIAGCSLLSSWVQFIGFIE